MTDSISQAAYPDVSIQDVGERTPIARASLEPVFAELIRPSFGGQDHGAAVKLLPVPGEPAPVLNLIRIAGGYLHIGEGCDGVAATADGLVIRETKRFAFAFETPAPDALSATAEAIDEDWVSVVDSAWPNHYHLLTLAMPRLYFARAHCPDARIVVPASRKAADAPPSMLERMIGLGGFSGQVRRLPDGLYRVRNLYLIWPNYRQPPFLHLFQETFSHLDAFARRAPDGASDRMSGTGGEALPCRFFIARPHNERLEDRAGVAALDACLTRHGFAKVRLEQLRLEEQIRLFRNATHVVGAHGAGLGNIVFAGPGLRLLEITMDLDGRGFTRPWFLLIAARKGMHYQYLNASEGQFTPRRLEDAFRTFMALPEKRATTLLARGVRALARRLAGTAAGPH